MVAILYLLFYLACGLMLSRLLLPMQKPLARVWLGLCMGLFLLMWLPALCAFAFGFTKGAHFAALGVALLLLVGAYFVRDKRPAAIWDEEEKGTLRVILLVALPLTLFSAYLQYTHNLRIGQDGGYYVGQSTYGDLMMHTSFITSLPGSSFPPDYSILPGELLCYPFFVDAMSASLYLFGASLQVSLVLPGILMMALCYVGFLIFARKLTHTKTACALACLFFFLNGGLGFLYDFDLSGSSFGESLSSILNGYYQTPTNRPADNLRWSNVICDMLVPQRTTLVGWCMLLPCLYLLISPLKEKKLPEIRSWVVLGVWAGGLVMIHTHSFLALGLCSLGMMAYTLWEERRGQWLTLLLRWGMYGLIAVLLALPQLLTWTFKQSLSSGNFLTIWFNWVNTSDGTISTMKDFYFWFYLKNIGLPLLLLLCALLEKDRNTRLLASGAFVIFLLAEIVRFQTNNYDNNKLFYVWYMLCAIIEADYGVKLFGKLKSFRGRYLLATLFLFASFVSAGLTCAREAVSNYQVFSKENVTVAAYVSESTDKDAVFLTGTQHLNPISSLSGRKIVCGPDSWLYYHGFNTSERQADIWRFYTSPLGNLDVLTKYNVDYVYVSAYERSNYSVDTAVLDSILTRVYADDYDDIILYQVPRNLLEGGAG